MAHQPGLVLHAHVHPVGISTIANDITVLTTIYWASKS